MEDKKQILTEEIAGDNTQNGEEVFEEVEEAVTAGWTGCASCCS